MPTTEIKFDFTNCMAFRVGQRSGITEDELNVMTLRAGLPQVLTATTREEGQPGFLQALDPEVIRLDAIREAWQAYLDRSPVKPTDLIVLGIGGSALSTLTLQAALTHPYWQLLPECDPKRPPVRVHVIDNSDPWQLEGLLDCLDPKTTGIYLTSKSGTTAETLCGFARVRDWMTAGGGQWKDQTVVCTDFPGATKVSALWSFAEENGLLKVGMPRQVGGRFSVFTGVGLLPALAMGLDIDALLRGAREMAERCHSVEFWENPAFVAAAVQCAYFRRPEDKRRNMVVLMPYAYRLRFVGDWFAQLWAESLGKRRGLDGSRTVAGQTPVKALGATDQHSQLQLYQEGPQDKVVVFVRVGDKAIRCPVPSLDEIAEVAHLGNCDLGELIDAELRATAFSLAQANRPSWTIEMPTVSEETMGGLLMFFMMATAIAGELLQIDAFDQPGVEGSKRAAHALFGREGEEYDRVRSEIADAEAGRQLIL